jgi:transitional endoplasmic reticulum ATPase
VAKTNRDRKIVDVVKVVNEGQRIILPEGMSLTRGIEALTREKNYQEETTGISANIDCLLPDGLHAFYLACKEQFGYIHGKSIVDWFGITPPSMMTIQTGLHTSVSVPWGRMELPGIIGWLQTGWSRNNDGRVIFQITGEVKRKHEPVVQELIALTKKIVQERSIYKAKAFRIRLKDDNGEYLPMPDPKFLELKPGLRYELVFNDDVRAGIETSIFTLVEHRDKVKALGVSLKRGVILSGPWGTGKSMTAGVVADLATAHGWTYMLCERADELKDVLRLARMYQPSVVFCEDIDRVMKGERSISMDDLLNVIDGVESKSAELLVILTTNDVGSINQAMLRPGRLDAVVEITPPDALSAQKLVRLYGRGTVSAEEDLTEVGQMLDGNIPAVIMEVVERSKLASLYRDPDANAVVVTSDDLRAAAAAMQNQLDLLKPREVDKRHPVEKAAQIEADSRIEAARITVAAGVSTEHGNGIREQAGTSAR